MKGHLAVRQVHTDLQEVPAVVRDEVVREEHGSPCRAEVLAQVEQRVFVEAAAGREHGDAGDAVVVVGVDVLDKDRFVGRAVGVVATGAVGTVGLHAGVDQHCVLTQDHGLRVTAAVAHEHEREDRKRRRRACGRELIAGRHE